MRVICINSKGQIFITIGRVYEIDYNRRNKWKYTDDRIVVLNDIGEYFAYPRSFFIELKEYRRLKLEKIVSRL